MKIVVIGELCYDYFIYGDCKRLSPEAPVPVLNPNHTESNPGMAGNVVENLFSIAGIGNLTMTAIRNQDLPLIVCLNGFIGLVTVVCYLILNVFQQRINGRTIKNKIVEG